MFDNSFLPFLPGYSFTNPAKKNFPNTQTLRYSKGCPVADAIIPDTPQYALELLDAENSLYDNTLVDLTYGPRRTFLKKTTVPEHVEQDKKVLRFYGYFQEEMDDCWGEEFRIHRVVIYYYLDGDKIEIVEPKVTNSGLPQGLLLRKEVVPKPDGKGMYLWRDLNLGIDLIIYGKRIRITDCDPWTKEYIESAGVILNPRVDDVPEDTYTKKLEEKRMKPQLVLNKVEDEKLWKFLNYDRMVLRFYALWDDTINEPSEMRKVVIHYYLADDTIEVLEVHTKNDGRDPYTVFIHRQKLPKSLKCLPETFPSTYMEYSEKEVKEWFKAEDFAIGKTIIIMQRKMLIYDCDEFTRRYYREHFDTELAAAVDVEEKPKKPVPKVVPPHSGLGTWEDSLQSCIYNIPRPPKKDMLKLFYNDDKFLRFAAHMDTVWPIDSSRRFVITFFPGDETVTIFEKSIPNSGVAGGCFLKRMRLRKPGTACEEPPVYYDASDFYIGAKVHACGRQFLIDDADRYVLSFMEENYKYYPEEVIETHRKKLVETKLTEEPMKSSKLSLQEKMRKCIINKFGNEPLPLPLNFSKGQCTHELMKNKLYAANVPLPRNLLDEAMDLCTEDNGEVNNQEMEKIFLYSFGHMDTDAQC